MVSPLSFWGNNDPSAFWPIHWQGVRAARQTGHTELCHSLSSNVLLPPSHHGAWQDSFDLQALVKMHTRLETQQAVLMHCADECKIPVLVYGCVHSRWMTSKLCPKVKSIYTPNNLKCTNVQCEYLHMRNNSIACHGGVWDWHVYFVSKVTEVLFAYANFSREKSLRQVRVSSDCFSIFIVFILTKYTKKLKVTALENEIHSV